MKAFFVFLILIFGLSQCSLISHAAFRYKPATETFLISTNSQDTDSNAIIVPLALGNRYQFRMYTLGYTGGLNEGYRLIEVEISKDTVINGKKYFEFSPGLFPVSCLHRYDSHLKKYYIRKDSIDEIYYDFNMGEDSAGYFYTPWSSFRIHSLMYNTNEFYFGEFRKTYSHFWNSYFDKDEESYAAGLGLTYYKLTAQNIGMHYYYQYNLISALIYDGSGGYKYYLNNYKPQIEFTPFLKLDGIQRETTFSVDVKHAYNGLWQFYGAAKDGLVYIDTVWCDYFYQKGDVKTDSARIWGKRTPVTSTYNFTMPLDTFLIRNGYELKYSITARDKALLPICQSLPLSGYYSAVYDPLMGVDETEGTVNTFSLEQNYPNPFNPVTTINYSIARRGHVKMSIFNPAGQEIRILLDGEAAPGKYTLTFDASDLSSGVYFCRLISGRSALTRKLLLLK